MSTKTGKWVLHQYVNVELFPNKVVVVNEDDSEMAYVPDTENMTCRMRHCWSDPDEGDCWKCSKCGELVHSFVYEPKYCSGCGRRVVS